MNHKLTRLFLSVSLIGISLVGCSQSSSHMPSLKEGQIEPLTINGDDPALHLFSDNITGFAFNAPKEVKQVTVYFDVYEKDKRIKHEEKGAISLDDLNDEKEKKEPTINGQLVWGQLSDYILETTDNQEEAERKMTPIALTCHFDGVSIGFTLPDVSQYPYAMAGFGSVESYVENNQVFPVNEPLVLGVWSTGDELSTYNEGSDYFKKENLTSEHTQFLYLIFSDKVMTE